MERNNFDYNPYSAYDSNFDPSQPNNDMYNNPMFNPMFQYEQTYMYYKSLCMQMDYKIKCKEYEKMCGGLSKDRKIE